MYADPTHLRTRVIKVRLNDDERDLVDALARLNKTQPAVLVRSLILDRLDALEQRSGQSAAA